MGNVFAVGYSRRDVLRSGIVSVANWAERMDLPPDRKKPSAFKGSGERHICAQERVATINAVRKVEYLGVKVNSDVLWANQCSATPRKHKD